MVFGSVFSLLLAFWAPKWTTLLRIGGKETYVFLQFCRNLVRLSLLN